MSKKILFMSSAKLTTICIGLLLAVFCTIGMSFTPAEEGDNVGNPNDTTYVSGPRRSHWNPGGCGGSDNNKKDYARTQAITMGHGTVSISNTTKNGSLTTATTKTSTSAAGNAATIDWDCNGRTDGHTNSFQLTATPDADYYFAGWSLSSSTNEAISTVSSIPIEVTIPHGEMGSAQQDEWENSNKRYTVTYYAFFNPIAYVDVTFAAVPSGCSYQITVSGSTQTINASNVVKTHISEATLSAPTAASGYVFSGWYQIDGAGNVIDLSSASSYTTMFSENVTLGARFIPTTMPKFKNITTGIEYYGLKAATVAAASGQTIVPVAEETLVDGSDLIAGMKDSYIVPAGVNLLIPYSSANTMQKVPTGVTKEAALSVYRKITLREGVTITVNGALCVGGQQMSGGGGNPTGYTTGACGMIDMSSGGHIEVNNGGVLYCWGFIKGQDMDQGNNTIGVGTITANSGAAIWEMFAVGDWRGGTALATGGWASGSTRFFPIQSYFIQNIEAPITLRFGATEYCYTNLNLDNKQKTISFPFIGSSKTLFKLSDSESVISKWYDPTTDLTCYELSGSAVIDALQLTIPDLPIIGSFDVNSADYDLPINSGMHIMMSDCNMTINKPIVCQPGAKIEIKHDANVTIATNIYMYDNDQWGAYAGPNYYFHNYGKTYGILTNHKYRGDGKSKELLDDAQFIVDGQLNITGKLYSTAGGANIMGNGGGRITFPSTLASSTTIDAYTSNGDKVSGGVAVNAANLCNENESYTKAIASTTFYNVHGRWFKSGNQNENADHTYNFTYIASGAVSGTGGTDVSPNTHNAVYAPDKTGLTAGMKWCNVVQDGTCSNIYNATQALNETPASDIRYTYPTDSWLQLLRTETEGVYGGSDNSLYAVDGCAVNSLGSVDENCLYTIDGVKKALVDGHFVALAKNDDDEAFHNTANIEDYYISFEGCTWHPATKEVEEKAYTVEGGIYIWYSGDWKLVEREAPYFFDYNDQNVKRYYEYENGEWVLASPRVRVQDAIETRDFYFLPEAITVASGKKNTTITILKDISGINAEMTYTAKNTTCTLDLNGHTVNGTCAKLLTINASGSTFTITDNTTEKNGRLENIFNQNAVTYNVTVTAGTLNLNAGTIYAQNLHQYRYKKGASDNVTSMGTRAVQVAAAQRFNITGGRVEANGKYEVYGIVANGSAANQTVVDISGTGEVYAEGALNTYGIACGGKLNLKAGLVEAHLNSSWANSYNTEGSDTDKKAHTTCRAITMSAKANATASSCYYGTLTVTGGTIKASTDATLALSYTSNVYGIYMNINVAGMGNRNFASTSGTNAQQASSIGSVKNAEIIVDNKANYGYGISVYGHYNSYNNSNSVFKVENTTVDVKAYYYAYGIYACGGIDGTTGECYTGDVELTNCTVTAEATTSDYAYATMVYAGQTTIYKDKQANYYGEYATAAKMTINSGTYTAKTKKSTAYAACTSTRAKTIYDPETSVAASRTLGEGIEAYPTLIIKGGTFTAEATTTTARAVSSGGNTTITGGTFNATATKYYAYGLYAVAGTLTASNITVNATAKGRVSSSDNNAYAYGVFADCEIISSGNQPWTGYTSASDVTLNNCTVNATATAYNNARGLSVEAKQALLTQAKYEAEKTTRKWDDATWAAYQAVFPGDNTSRAIAARATVNGGTFTVTAKNATAYGAFSTKTVVTNTQGAMASPEMTLNNATFTANVTDKSGAYGIYSGGPTTINGCTISATAKTTTASGVLNVDKTTTIKNSTITATATDAAYGLEGRAEINATHGYCWHGDFDLSEAGSTSVTAEAKTKAKTSYTIYLKAAKLNIATGGDFDGDYATASNATINGGTYEAKFNTSGSAYVISLSSQQVQGEAVAQPEVEVLDGFFNGASAEVGTAGVVGHMQLKGGYFVHNTNLATYAVAPKKVLTLRESHTLYPDYKYTINEGGTVTWKNGSTTLKTEMYESGETPEYTGTPPTKTDAEYEYTHNGWDPTIVDMDNSDATYSATFSQTEKKYSVSVAAGANGSVSPASVSGIGCVTASGDITAVSNTGYHFVNWTIPEGVATADGYTASSNPIRIHATASGKTITANFEANTYTVTLDNQSATTAGESSVTATYGAAMPSIAANLPEKTGYTFDGYYSATNGGGTQYYNADGTSAHVWDIDGETTLYAKWTPAVASVTAGSTTTYYATIEAAFAAANSSVTYDPTITLLRDASTATTTFISYTGARNCTLNLNGHTLSSTTAQALLYINMEGITFTITDLTESKLGTLHLESTSTSDRWCVYVAKGNLQMDAGTISLHSKANQFNEAVRIDPAASTFTMNGGKVHVVTSDSKPACGIVSKGVTVINGGAVQVEASGIGYGIEARVKDTNIGNITVNGGKFLVTGTTAACAYKSAANATLKLQGGYYNTNTNLEANCETNYHVLPLTGEDPYKYEVAEAYQLAWNLGGGTVTTAGTQAPVDATGTPSGYVAKGATLTAPVVEKTGYTFDGWNTSGGTAAATMPAANTTYTAKWVAAIADRELDIVDWTSSSITINVTNLKAESGTNKNNWKIFVNDEDYDRTDCNTARTLTISGLSLTPNENLLIQLKNDADVIESQHNYKIPQIYNAENATLNGTTSSSVVYVYGGKLTISDDITLAALYVCPGAEVEVTGTLTVGKLVLRTKPWATAAISGNVSATNVYYTRIAPDGSVAYPTGQYYQFGLPYECAISAVRLSDGTTPAYNTTWILKSYNEEKRATSGTENNNWDVLSSGTIAAGRGYEMFSSYKYYREYYFPVTPTDNTSVAVTRHGDDKNNSGWNIVCSPLMSVYENKSNPVDGLKVSWLLIDGSYDQEWPETIWPALPFSYQASATGYLDFSKDNFGLQAPRRRAAYDATVQTEWLHLDVKDMNGVGDHTSIFAHPTRFAETYETGIDVAKQSFSASRALIYSSHAYGEMAFAGVADALLENGVALTVYSPKPQELTISMRDNEWLDRMAYVWLIDNETGAQIDLLDSDYTFEAAAGTMTGRFILMGRFFAPQIATDIDEVDGEQAKPKKLIIRDKLYILINDQLYDGTGKMVK